MTTTETRQQSQADGFEPLRPYTLESYAELEARVIAANERAAVLEEQLAAVIAERDAAEHRAADLEDRNRELASDLDNALDLASENALHAERERLVPQPIYGHAFAGLVTNRNREGIER
ncbi:hypothetical protein OHB12_33730 [Nocardia sp. NBC_01730]|uniref:hypothetical protein n=1 Tax=Nocardia sp. NBC_01730 TaxID=2975998 RepID=UPI002E1022A9|nr:hypothetical protein OHB12_33730 [Nocardia sp. NBC_01730]